MAAAVPGWLAMPASPRRMAGYPAVIWVHGGPASQSRANFRPDMQALLAAGYAVLMPNVRGSTGYGRARMESDDRERRLDSVHDLAAGRHALAAQPGIDPERIAVMGQSYGGYMVNAAITEYPELWKAAINLYGIADFVTLLEADRPMAPRAPQRGIRRPGAPSRPVRPHLADPPHRPRPRARCWSCTDAATRACRSARASRSSRRLRLRQRKVRFETFDYAGHGFIRPDDKAPAVSGGCASGSMSISSPVEAAPRMVARALVQRPGAARAVHAVLGRQRGHRPGGGVADPALAVHRCCAGAARC